jgi:hypothetical protein
MKFPFWLQENGKREINVCHKRFEKSNFCEEFRFSVDVSRIPSIFSELFNENRSRNTLKYEENYMDRSTFEFFALGN